VLGVQNFESQRIIFINPTVMVGVQNFEPLRHNNMDNKTKYNPAIHHRKSIRLKGYDYSQNGLYFITICTYNRECLFGEIINKKMILNDAGKIANECWLKIPEHFPDAVLHEHVVMPNHVHGIIELAGPVAAGDENAVGVQNFEPLQPPTPPPPPQNQFQHIIPRSMGSIVRGYKIGVTKFFRDNTDIYHVWQRNYHEHIIRTEQSYWRISEYIINNPDVWENDKFFRR
jgi:REP element-mobilizing transposase RayT